MTTGSHDPGSDAPYAEAGGDATWHAIVEALEQDVQHSEELARERSRPAGVPEAIAPSQSRLPTTMPHMPSPATMPEVPPEVVERIHVLQARISELSRELHNELATLRPPTIVGSPIRLGTSFEPLSQPRFFDGLA